MEFFDIRGFVLKEQTYKENDKIIWILCENMGKISVLVKNAKKSNNKFFSISQPYTLVELNLERGKNFYYITDGTIIKNLDYIKNRDNIFHLVYFFELMDVCFMENERINNKFFKFLINVFLMFEVPEINIDLILRVVELKLLSECGCNIEFEHCYYCSNKIKGNVCYFDFLLQNVVCVSCSKLKEFKIENRIINIMRFLTTVNMFNIQKIKISDKDIEVIFNINKFLLEQSLGRIPNSIKFLGGF